MLRRVGSLGILGAVALAVALATPANSQADHFGCFPSGSYGYGYSNVPRSSFYYRGDYSPAYYSSYRTYYHPTSTHWTPDVGWHTHGHYHVVPNYGYYQPIRSYYLDLRYGY